MSTETTRLSDLSLTELKQRRAKVLEELVTANKETKIDDSWRIVVNGFEVELQDLRAEIDKREGRQREENEEARRHWHSKNGKGDGYEVGVPLRPDQSFREYMQQRGMIKEQYDGLTLGGLARALLLGPKNDVQRRALAEGSDSSGGVTVPIDTLSRSFDLLRPRLVVVRLGASSLPTETEKTVVAKLASDPSVGWRLENAPITPSDPTFDSVLLQARSLACLVTASRELIEDSVNAEQMLNNAFLGSMASEVDRVCLVGSGTPPEPKGIALTDNVNSVDLQGQDIDSFDPFINAMVKCWQSNSQVVSGIVMSPANLGIVSKLKETVNGQPLQKPSVLAPVPMEQTTNCPNNIVIVGDFTQLILGFRATLRLEVLRELFAQNLRYGFLAHLRFDCAVAHPEAFCTLDNVSLS